MSGSFNGMLLCRKSPNASGRHKHIGPSSVAVIDSPGRKVFAPAPQKSTQCNSKDASLKTEDNRKERRGPVAKKSTTFRKNVPDEMRGRISSERLPHCSQNDDQKRVLGGAVLEDVAGCRKLPPPMKRNSEGKRRAARSKEPKVYIHSWEEYLREKNVEAAPTKAFKQRIPPPKNQFVLGTVLALKNDLAVGKFFLVQVGEKKGFRIKLQYVFTHDKATWRAIDSETIEALEPKDLKPANFSLPPGYTSDITRFPKKLEKKLTWFLGMVLKAKIHVCDVDVVGCYGSL